MKRFILFVTLITIIISILVVNVSAAPAEYPTFTIIGGEIFDAFTNDSISNAKVLVECYRGDNINTKETKSLENGKYIAMFSQNSESGCFEGDTVKVSATKDDFFGENTGIIDSHYFDNLDIGIIHVPMVPEFSILIASLTMISAVAIFFVVRRK